MSESSRSTERTKEPYLPAIALMLLVVGYSLLFGWLSLERYWTYEMHALDMGNMSQAAWNTLHGHPFAFTNMRLAYGIEAWNTTTRLSFHVEALFPLISLVYLAYPHPESLLVLQTAALALGAIPVYLLARDVMRSAWLGVAFAFAYLLFPSLQALNLYEFHPVALATPLLLCAFLFAWRKQYLPFVLCCAAAMGTKEQIGLVVALFGIYVAVINRDWAVGLGTAGAGTCWSLFATLVVEHHFRQPGTRTYLRSRYPYLGHGLRGALHTVGFHPGVIADVVFTWSKAGYLTQLLAPTGFLSLFAAPLLLLGLPTVGLNLLSTDFHMSSALGDNSAELIAVVMIAAILGGGQLARLLQQRFTSSTASLAVGAYLVAVSLWSQHVNGFSPIGPRFHIPTGTRHQHVEDRFVAMIPASAPVSTQDQLDPHLSNRRYVYLFEDTGRKPPLAPANHVLLDVSAPSSPLPSQTIHDLAMNLIHSPGWGVAAAEDGLILIRNGARGRSIPPAFYTYMDAGTQRPSHILGSTHYGITVLGYDVNQVDLPNHRIPNLAYTFYLRPKRRVHSSFQPVVYAREGNNLLQCASIPLGLAWLPTERWRTGRTYVVRMMPMEIDQSEPGTASMSVSLQRTPNDNHTGCSALWSRHGDLLRAGSLDISF